MRNKLTYEDVPHLSEKYEYLFQQASIIYKRHNMDCEAGIVDLSTAIGLAGGYLSDRRALNKLRRPVERAVLLRYGIGPVEKLLYLLGNPNSVDSTIEIDKAWDHFHAEWSYWRTGTAEEFNYHLTILNPKGGLLGANPLAEARQRVVSEVSTKTNLSKALIVDNSAELDVPESTKDVDLFACDTLLNEGRKNAHSPEIIACLSLVHPDASPLTRAFHYALTLSSRSRASGAPTISHLQQVVGIVLENGGSLDEGVAAFLHDIAEDYGEDKLKYIEDAFGHNVASIVRECSDSYKVEGQHREAWFPRKHKFLKNLPRKSVSALRVMVADKLHNARAMLRDGRVEGDQLWAKLKRTPEETTAYFTVAQRILAARLPSSPTTELGLATALLESSFCNPSLLGEKITAFSRDLVW